MQKVIIGLAPNIAVEISSDDVKKIVEQASFWSNLPKQCPLCEAGIVFFHRTPQDNEYFGLACTGPVVHESNFGQYRQTERGLYYKGDWQEAYAAYQTASRGQGDEAPERPQQTSPTTPAQANLPADPVARSLGDMVTSKQSAMIYAVSKDLGIDKDEECHRLMGCGTDELSKRAASDFIEHLQVLQKNPQARAAVPMNRATEQTAPAPAPAPAASAPAAHPLTCSCDACNIPF